VQRADIVPFEAVGRVAGAGAVADGVAAQFLADEAVMALLAGQVELALPALEEGLAGLVIGFGRAVGLHIDRQAARQRAEIGGHRQKLGALIAEGGLSLALDTALLDAVFEVEQLAGGRIDLRVMRRGAAQALLRVGMAGGAGLPVR